MKARGYTDETLRALPMANGAIVGLQTCSRLLWEWAQCASIKACIAPPGSSRGNHRQDQSALTLLLYRVLGIRSMPRNVGFASQASKHEPEDLGPPVLVKGWHILESSWLRRQQQTHAHAPLVILTAAAKPRRANGDDIEAVQRSAYLRATCRARELDCRLLGQDAYWQGWRWLAKDLYAPYLAALPSSTIAVVMDGSDVFIQAGPEEILANYRIAAYSAKPGMGTTGLHYHASNEDIAQVVGSLESGCPVHESKCASFPDTDANATGIAHLIHQNGGFMIGPAGLLAEMWGWIGR